MQGISDILCMQEVQKRDFSVLTAQLNGFEWIGQVEEYELCPIFYRKSLFTLLSTSTLWLSEFPEVPGSKSWGSYWPRICTWAKFYEKASGYEFYVFNVHLENLSSMARYHQALMLVHDVIPSVTNFENVNIYLVGDMNDVPESLTYKILTQEYSNTRVLAKYVEGSSSTVCQVHNASKEPPPIDYIFRNLKFDVNLRNHTHITLKDGRLCLSDHLPVQLVIEMK